MSAVTTWQWRRRYAKPDMGTCEAVVGCATEHAASGAPVLRGCDQPATHTVVGPGLLFPAFNCAAHAAELAALGYETREGEWDARRGRQ